MLPAEAVGPAEAEADVEADAAEEGAPGVLGATDGSPVAAATRAVSPPLEWAKDMTLRPAMAATTSAAAPTARPTVRCRS